MRNVIIELFPEDGEKKNKSRMQLSHLELISNRIISPFVISYICLLASDKAMFLLQREKK